MWSRVQELFHEATLLEPGARESFLASVTATDARLAGELRSLLAAHDESSGFLSRPPSAPVARGVSPGDRLGPYRILEEVGHGGMGVVYRATREGADFTREVAIKLIEPGMRSEEILRRFRAERQILALLDHPHIARLVDGGSAPDGGPYLVMDYVAGQPLLEYCDQRRLGIDARLALFLAVCDAVQFAHQRLVVHRDLKSDNILVTPDGSPRLLDFGIAKLLSPDTGQPAATLTAPMQRMLTPEYASPEQVRGEPAAVSTDVYSLGVILYELLSGSRPLRFATRTPEEILRVVTEVDPPSPSSVMARATDDEAARRRGDTTRRLARRLSGDLDGVVLKALEKNPARRYGSVDQLAQDLRRHLEGLPVLARGPSATYRLSRFVRRHRVAVVSTALVASSLVAGLAGMTWQAGVARQQRDRANRRFAEVRALAHAVMFDLHDAIAPLPGSTRARETLVEHSLRYLDGLRRDAGNDPLLEREVALAYAKIGDVQGRPMYPNLGRSAQALESYTKALALLREASRALPESTAILSDKLVVNQRLADLLGVMGRHDEALKQTLGIRDELLAGLSRHPGDPNLQSGLGVAYGRLVDQRLNAGDTLGAIEACAASLRLSEEFFRAGPANIEARRGVLIGWAKLAGLHAMRGDRDSARAGYVRAERLALEAVAALPNNTDASRDLSIVYGMRGLFLAEGGELDSALAVYDLGMRITETLAAADPDNALQQADVAAGHFEIGTMLVQQRRDAAALDRFTRAFGGYARLAAADTSNADHRVFTARSARQAGEVCWRLSRHASSAAERSRWRALAIDWLERSLALYRSLGRSGALPGEEADAPEQLNRRVAEIREAI